MNGKRKRYAFSRAECISRQRIATTARMRQAISWRAGIIILVSAERPEHAPSPAGAGTESHNASKPTGEPENSGAGDGCCVSPCSESSFIGVGSNVRPMRSFGDGGDDLMDGRLHPEVVDEMNMRPVDELTVGTAVSTIPRKNMPYIRFSIADEKVKNRTAGFLGNLVEKLSDPLRSLNFLRCFRPKMINVIVLEDRCVEISEGTTAPYHLRYVRVPKQELMAELHRFTLLGEGEKLRQILGGLIFEVVSNCINHVEGHFFISSISNEILWLKLVTGADLEKRSGVLRVSVGYREDTRFPRPIQHQYHT